MDISHRMQLTALMAAIVCLMLLPTVTNSDEHPNGDSPQAELQKQNPLELVNRYLKHRDSSALASYEAQCRAGHADALRALPEFAKAISPDANEKQLCDIYTMMLQLRELPPAVIQAIEARFTPHKPQPFSTTFEAALLLKVDRKHAAATAFISKQMVSKRMHDRAIAARVIGDCGEAKGHELQKLLADPSPAVRTHAAWSHWKLHRQKDVVAAVLLGVLGAKKQDFAPMRPTAISEWQPGNQYLAAAWFVENHRSHASIIPVMQRLADSEDTALRSLAADFLQKR